MQQRWAEIEIAATGDGQEAAGALLTETAGCHGYSADAAGVRGYLPVDERLEGTLLRLRDALRAARIVGVPADLTIRFVAEDDWANAWKQYFKPQRIGKRLVVKPTWEPWDAAPDDIVIHIDPGMAFGTGLHATTRLCLRALEERVRPGVRVADVGTGSGILAVAAAHLGARHVDAVDIDPLAVRIARENVALNGVADTVSVAEASTVPEGPFDIVVANILADVILALADSLQGALAPGGTLIASGIIEHRAEDVRRGLTAAGFAVEKTDGESEWVAIVAARP